MPLPLVLALILSAMTGLLVGSFLATLVLRLPAGQPIVLARSACPQCGHRLGPAELIPVLSWLIQKRRCRACGGTISPFYAAMEIASAAVAGAAVFWLPWPAFLAAAFLGWALLCVAAWGLIAIFRG